MPVRDSELLAHRCYNLISLDVLYFADEYISATTMIDLDHVGWFETIKGNIFWIVPYP